MGFCDASDLEPLLYAPLIGELEVLIGEVINERPHALIALAVLEDGVAVIEQDESGEANDVVTHGCSDKCSALESIECCEVRHSAGPLHIR